MQKKIKPILLLVVLIFMLPRIKAQDSAETQKRENFFYIAPADLFFNTLQLGYERKTHNHNSVAVFGGFKLSKKEDRINKVGGNAEVQYRINLLYNKEGITNKLKNHSGFAYFAPFLHYRYEEASDFNRTNEGILNSTTSYIHTGMGGFGFGIRLAGLQNRFCLNLFAGGGMKYSQVTGDKKYEEFLQVGYTGIAPKVEFHMGIAF